MLELKSEAGMEELRFAILKQACIDYKDALTVLRKRDIKQNEKAYLQARKLQIDCERFFQSDYFGILCDISGTHIMKQIRESFYNRPIRWGKES